MHKLVKMPQIMKKKVLYAFNYVTIWSRWQLYRREKATTCKQLTESHGIFSKKKTSLHCLLLHNGLEANHRQTLLNNVLVLHVQYLKKGRCKYPLTIKYHKKQKGEKRLISEKRQLAKQMFPVFHSHSKISVIHKVLKT